MTVSEMTPGVEASDMEPSIQSPGGENVAEEDPSDKFPGGGGAAEEDSSIQCPGGGGAAEEDPSIQSPGGDVTRRRKYAETAVIYTGFILAGLCYGIQGPSVVDFELVAHTDTRTITRVFIGRSLGGLFGAVISGLFLERVNSYLISGYSVFGMCIFLALIPWTWHVIMLSIMLALSAMHGGFYDCAGNVLLLRVWGSENGPWMQALHAMFGVGLLLGPVLVEPFLAPDEGTLPPGIAGIVTNEEEDILPLVNPGLTDALPGHNSSSNRTSSLVNDTSLQNSTKLPGSNMLTFVGSNAAIGLDVSINTSYLCEGNSSVDGNCPDSQEELITHIWIPYLIIGFLGILSAAVFFALNFTKSQRDANSVPDVHKNKETNSKSNIRVLFIILVLLFYMANCATEIGFQTYLFAYTVKQLGWSKSDGVLVSDVFYVFYVAGRVVGILIIRYVRPGTLLLVDTACLFLSMLPLLLLPQHTVAVWVTVIGNGCFVARLFATGITYVDQHVAVRGLVSAVFMIAACAGDMVGPVVLSALYLQHGLSSFPAMVTTSSALVLAFCICLMVTARRMPPRDQEASIQLNAETQVLHARDSNVNGINI